MKPLTDEVQQTRWARLQPTCSCCKDDKTRRYCEAFAAVMPWWALLGMLLVVTAFAMLGRGVLG